MLHSVLHFCLFHNLVDIGHTSVAFGVGLLASAVSGLLFSHYFFHDEGTPVMRDDIIRNIFRCV
jgi:hypothetical protein